jgi:dihydrodipicolinate synthase/N-acetylneuraminate lyase
VFVRPGTDLGKSASDRSIAENMRPIVEMGAQRGLAIGLYSIPDVSGWPMSPEAATELVQGPGGQNIVAIKITESSYEGSTQKFLNDARLSRLKIVQGWDPFLARARREGGNRCGVTSGPMSFAVYQYLHMFAAADRGEWDELAIAQTAVTALFQAMQDDPGKFADLQRAKFIMGLGQPLTGTVTSEQVKRVLSTLTTLPRAADRQRLARSLNLMEDGPFHEELAAMAGKEPRI